MAEIHDVMPRPYRIALLGFGNAGKTCALGALLLPKLAHAAGLSVKLAEAATGVDPGLQRATKRIEEGKIPGRTGNESLNSALQLVLSVPGGSAAAAAVGAGEATPPPQHFVIDTFDYPGSLLSSPQRDGSATETLQARLRDADSLLVLIEAAADPRAERQQRIQRTNMLEQLAHTANGRPIAILLTKWDRLLSHQDARPRFGGDVEVQHRSVLDPAKAASDFLSTADASEYVQFVSSVKKMAGEQNVGVFASSSLGEVVACYDIYQRSSDRLYKIWSLGSDSSSEAPPAADSAARLVYETKGRRFDVEKFDEGAGHIEYRDLSGARAKVAFEPENMVGSIEPRVVNWPMQKGARALASFGIEDALLWLVRRCNEKAVEALEHRASELGPLSIGASWPRIFGSQKTASASGQAGRAERSSLTSNLIDDSRSVAERLAAGSSERSRAIAVMTRVRRLRLGHLFISAFAALAVSPALGLAGQTAQDAVWAAGVKTRMTALNDVGVPSQLHDFRQMGTYRRNWLRHFLSYKVVWDRAEVGLTREKLRAVLERKLYDAVKASAARDPRIFLDAQPRAELSTLIEDNLEVTKRPAIRDIMQDVRRRLVKLDQPVVFPQVQFMPATPDAHGSIDALNYIMKVRIDKEERPFFQPIRRTVKLDQPKPIDTRPQPTNLTRGGPLMQIDGSLLRTLDSELCFSDEVPPGGRGTISPVCETTKVDLLQAVRSGTLELAAAGPVIAKVAVEWHAIVPKVPPIPSEK